MTNLKVPSLHLNGSGFTNLSKQYKEAVTALSGAIQAMPVPHGRDYYVQEEGAFLRAREEYENRITLLTQVLKELDFIWEKIYAQHVER